MVKVGKGEASVMRAWPLFRSSRLREQRKNGTVVDCDIEAARNSGHEFGLGLAVAVQRLCCRQTVLLGSRLSSAACQPLESG